MAPLSSLLTVALVAGVEAFSTNSGIVSPATTSRPSTHLNENFGFDFAEDQVENTPQIILGEANYKKWVNGVDPNNMLNRQYALFTRVRELGLIEQTAELGVLSKLEKQGLTLEKTEELLPLLEQFGVLSLVGNNQQLLINGLAPVAVEGAPFILPVIAKALDIGPPAFYGAAAAVAGLEGLLFANNVQVPFIGLAAGGVLGLVLIPLTLVLVIVGAALGSLKD
jgi:hypothetical protein